MKTTLSLICLMLVLSSGAALAQGECYQFRRQIENSCRMANAFVEAKRSVEEPYNNCVGSIPPFFASIISVNRQSNLYKFSREWCWTATHSGYRVNCASMANLFLNGCRVGFRQ